MSRNDLEPMLVKGHFVTSYDVGNINSFDFLLVNVSSYEENRYF